MTSIWGALLLALSLGLGGAQKAPSPSPKQALVYAPESADHMVFVNVRAILGPAIATANTIIDQPFIKEFPEVYDAAKMGLREMSNGLGMIQQQFGFDVTKDIAYLVAWVRYRGEGAPDLLLAVKGKFGDDPLGKISQVIGGQITELRGRPAMRAGPMLMMFGADGTLLFGSPEWVEERSLATWSGRRPKGVSALAAKALKNKPFLLLASQPSDTARSFMQAGMDDEELALFRDMFTRHNHMSLWLAADGVGWEWAARDAEAFATASMASEGMIELMRAGQVGVRGFVRLALAGLSSYTEVEPMIARVVKHRDSILKFVVDRSGDGTFKAKVSANARKRTVTVVAKSKRLDQVLPVGALIPMVGAGAAMVMLRSADGMMMDPGSEKAEEPARTEPDQPGEARPAPEPAPPAMDVDPKRPVIDPSPEK
jgi:hypothetical protein